MSCGVGRRHSLDLALLCLWCRLVAVALNGPLVGEPPYAAGAALKSTHTQKNFDSCWFSRLGFHPHCQLLKWFRPTHLLVDWRCPRIYTSYFYCMCRYSDSAGILRESHAIVHRYRRKQFLLTKSVFLHRAKMQASRPEEPATAS